MIDLFLTGLATLVAVGLIGWLLCEAIEKEPDLFATIWGIIQTLFWIVVVVGFIIFGLISLGAFVKVLLL